MEKSSDGGPSEVWAASSHHFSSSFMPKRVSTMWPRTNSLPALCLGALMYKTGIITVSTHKLLEGLNELIHLEGLRTMSGIAITQNISAIIIEWGKFCSH